MRRTVAIVVLVLLLVTAYLAQTLSTLATTAPTSDEVVHLPAGYAQLYTGRPTLNSEHPPLAKLIAAAALWPAGGPPSDLSPHWRDLDEWNFGQLFLFKPGRDPTALINRARRGPILVGLMLCLVCFAWSTKLYGVEGGLFTLALCVFCPTLLAHDRLVTTDVPVAAFGVLSALLAWTLMSRPTIERSITTGLALGAAMAAKFTGPLFVVALGLAIAQGVWKRRLELGHRGPNVRRGALLVFACGLAAAAVVGLSYGWPPSISAYIQGFGTVGANFDPSFQPFMLGHFSTASFPLYFPVAFLLKTSPAVLIALALLVALPFLRRAPWLAERVVALGPDARPFLWVAPVLYGAFMMARAPDIGVRYIIPVYPFLFVALGMLGASLWAASWGRALVLGLVALHVRAAAQAWPDPISYFNGLFGCRGPMAVRCLDDSNFDWGQDLGRVADVVNEMRSPDEEIVLLYHGSAIPGGYVPRGRFMSYDDLLHPRPQLYAVSINQLQRMVYHVGAAYDMDWFQRFHPVAVIGNTYFIYDFRPPELRRLPPPGTAPSTSGL